MILLVGMYVFARRVEIVAVFGGFRMVVDRDAWSRQFQLSCKFKPTMGYVLTMSHYYSTPSFRGSSDHDAFTVSLLPMIDSVVQLF
jgi:hypothetical protein